MYQITSGLVLIKRDHAQSQEEELSLSLLHLKQRAVICVVGDVSAGLGQRSDGLMKQMKIFN